MWLSQIFNVGNHVFLTLLAKTKFLLKSLNQNICLYLQVIKFKGQVVMPLTKVSGAMLRVG